jgi:hypothetical protein
MLMKRTIFLTFILAVALSASVALGDNDKVQRVPAGAVAFHFVAKFTPPNLVGYIAFIEGVQGPFFLLDDPEDIPGEGTAYFTVRLDLDPEPDAFPLPTADLTEVFALYISPGLTFGVFYDETPDANWADPGSFSDGERVATFEESAFLGTTILSAGTTYNLFSNRLIWSKSFRVGDQRVDFKKLVPNGVTINNIGSILTDAFNASAVAIGGDDDN